MLDSMQLDPNAFLTEKKLIDYLRLIFPNEDWISNRKIPSAPINNRPDYYNAKMKIIIEFDGDSTANVKGHYSNAEVISIDYKKDKVYKEMDFKVIRIPYFVQIATNSIYDLFGLKNIKVKQIYPHGFWNKNAKLPADYNELGIKRFENDLERLPSIRQDIIDSLKTKIIELGNIDLVLPNKLKYLIK
ncbi:MAG: hypothetical protein ACYDA4_04165 [Ignavibacteriaceae bacterium]